MSIEQKIKEMLGRATEQIDESAVDLSAQGLGAGGAAASAQATKDTTLKAANAGDTTQPKQGSSEDASFEDNEQETQGKTHSAAISKDTTITPAVAGDVTAPKQGSSEDAVVAEDANVRDELNAIFGEELSEDFRNKATSIFEAAVIARTNSEVEKLTTQLEEANAAQLTQYKEELVERVDSYLSYVVENWMSENEIAIENGLRTEIAEDFIQGLRGLFVESFIEVPEERYDVIGELQAKSEDLEAKLNEAINSNVELNKEVVELKRKETFEEAVKGLAETEVEKLAKLVEGVEFESADLYREKLAVIRENYFPKADSSTAEDALLEDVATSYPTLTASTDTIAAYAQALSRSVKRK